MVFSLCRNPIALSACVALLFTSLPGYCHDGVMHKTLEDADAHVATTVNTVGFPDIKGDDFNLIDQNGSERTSRDPGGNYQLVFFGYASCKAICDVALPRMAEAVNLLEVKNVMVTPVLITVDPERDTIETLRDRAAEIHPRLIGLTGSNSALQQAYKAFQIEKSLVYENPDEGPIYAHGSFIYLLDPEGKFKTLFPPILGSERIAEVTTDYVEAKK